MIRRIFKLKACMLLLALSTGLAAANAQQLSTAAVKPASSGLVSVKGAKAYYEIYGEGKPIVLLHGSFMTIGMNWGQLIPELSRSRKVIALELQGHGHSPYSERELSFPTLANDVADVMKHLKIEKADILGYSFGGTIAYQLAMQSPALVNNLIIISAPYKMEGWQPEVREGLKALRPEFLDQTPLRTAYVAAAPDSTKWHPFLAKMIAFANKPYTLGDVNVQNIKSPVLLLMGDNDGIDKIGLMNTYKLLGGAVVGDLVPMPKSQLAIIPNTSHTSLIMDTPAILSTMTSFLQKNN